MLPSALKRQIKLFPGHRCSFAEYSIRKCCYFVKNNILLFLSTLKLSLKRIWQRIFSKILQFYRVLKFCRKQQNLYFQFCSQIFEIETTKQIWNDKRLNESFVCNENRDFKSWSTVDSIGNQLMKKSQMACPDMWIFNFNNLQSSRQNKTMFIF